MPGWEGWRCYDLNKKFLFLASEQRQQIRWLLAETMAGPWTTLTAQQWYGLDYWYGDKSGWELHLKVEEPPWPSQAPK